MIIFCEHIAKEYIKHCWFYYRRRNFRNLGIVIGMIRMIVFIQCGIMLLLGMNVTGQEKCDIRSPCPCENTDKGIRLNCFAGRSKTVIPKQFPKSTYVINFQYNLASSVKTKQFNGLSNLVLLRLDNNNITELQSKAFHGLPSLEDLYLSDNKLLQHIPDDILDPTSPFSEGVKLNNDNIITVPLNLLKRSKKIISLKNNPLHCDCFAIIPNSLRNNVFGTCTSPARLAGRRISTIKPSDVNCEQCSSKNCNNGSCYLLKNTTKCLCFTGYSGEFCDIILDRAGNSNTTSTDQTLTTQTTITTKESSTTTPAELSTTTPAESSTTTVKTKASENPSTISKILITTLKTTVSLSIKDTKNKISVLQTSHIVIIILGIACAVILAVALLKCYYDNRRKKYKEKFQSDVILATNTKLADLNSSSRIYEEIKRPLPKIPVENLTTDGEILSQNQQQLQQQQECCYEIEPHSEDAYLSSQQTVSNPWNTTAEEKTKAKHNKASTRAGDKDTEVNEYTLINPNIDSHYTLLTKPNVKFEKVTLNNVQEDDTNGTVYEIPPSSFT